jgi:hypothetical protein
MLNTVENRERRGARGSGKREQPRRRWGCLGDRTECRMQGGWGKPTSVEVLHCPHGRDDTIHVHADRIGRPDRNDLCVSVPGLTLQLAPARDDAASEAQSIAEPLGGRDRLFRGLTIDV